MHKSIVPPSLTVTACLDLQLSIPNLRQRGAIRIQRDLDLSRNQLLHDLRRPAHERRRIRQCLQLRQNRLEEGLLLDTLDQVVGLALLLDDSAGLVGEDTAREILAGAA